jgi:peroxiredoxin Q/BCP
VKALLLVQFDIKDMEETSQGFLSEGDNAPEFTFEDNNFKEAKLSNYKNRSNIIVYFYPRDFTPGCSTEAAEFTEDYQEFANLGIEIMGISSDTKNSHTKFKERFHIPYILVSDPENIISKQYGIFGKKTFMGKEYFGVARSTFLIDKKGKIIKIFHKVKPSGHSKEVKEFFNAWMSSNKSNIK